MYDCYTRPFKSSLHNVIIIYEDTMTFLCFVLLFRYASQYSVLDLATSQKYAYYFSLLVFFLTVVPAVLALLSLLASFRDFAKICNWKRDFQDEKEQFDSSEEELNETDDLLKN